MDSPKKGVATAQSRRFCAGHQPHPSLTAAKDPRREHVAPPGTLKDLACQAQLGAWMKTIGLFFTAIGLLDLAIPWIAIHHIHTLQGMQNAG